MRWWSHLSTRNHIFVCFCVILLFTIIYVIISMYLSLRQVSESQNFLLHYTAVLQHVIRTPGLRNRFYSKHMTWGAIRRFSRLVISEFIYSLLSLFEFNIIKNFTRSGWIGLERAELVFHAEKWKFQHIRKNPEHRRHLKNREVFVAVQISTQKTRKL